jgi:hypothetical protein
VHHDDGYDLTLWIVAGLLAIVYLGSGAGKLIVPKEKLATAPAGDGSKTSAPAASRPSEPSRSWLRWA